MAMEHALPLSTEADLDVGEFFVVEESSNTVG